MEEFIKIVNANLQQHESGADSLIVGFNWEKGYFSIQSTSTGDQGPSHEEMGSLDDIDLSKDEFQSQMLLEMKKIAYCNYSLSVCFVDFVSQSRLFESRSCTTFKERVMHMKQKQSKDFLQLNFTTKGCAAEIYFYWMNDGCKDISLLFTAGYHNPHFTNELLANVCKWNSMYVNDDGKQTIKIGFIGTLSADQFQMVSNWVNMVSRKLDHYMESAERQKREAAKIDNMNAEEVKLKFFDEPAKSTIPKRRGPGGHDNEPVDLTEMSGDEKETDGDSEVSSEFYYESCCSEILEAEPPDGIPWDEQIDLSLYRKDPGDVFDYWMGILEFNRQKGNSDMEEEARNYSRLMEDTTENIPIDPEQNSSSGHRTTPSSFASDQFPSSTGTSRDQNRLTGQFRQRNEISLSQPRLGRGIEPKGSLLLNLDEDWKYAPKSKLFDPNDFKSITRIVNETKPFSYGFVTPKLGGQDPKREHRSISVLEQTPSARRPINTRTFQMSFPRSFSRTDRIMSLVEPQYTTNDASPTSGYDHVSVPATRRPQFAVISQPDMKNDPIVIDDDDGDDENNNTNKPKTKRRLLSPDEFGPTPEPRKNRIFKTKTASRAKPDFSQFDGQNRR